MHMKLLDESTLLVGEYPEGIADGPQIEANIQYVISKFKTATGRDYKVVRIPMPPDQFGRYPDDNGFYRTYSNAMFVNKTILVPTYEERYDTTALRIWQEAMPGYKIVGIDCNAIIPAGGAIHCITKEIGAEAPLLITHVQPPVDADDESLILTATAKHRTGVEGMSVSVRRAGEDFLEFALVPDDEDRWVVTLDMFEPGDSLQYFFTATSVDGKQRTRPLVAPEGFYTLRLPEVATSVYDINDLDLSVFPNPSNGITTLDLGNARDVREIVISDVAGRTVRSWTKPQISGHQQVFFDTSEWTSGLYMIRISGPGYSTIEKISVL
jgi:hypothetical protein